jgi:hypothetical protein
MKKLNTKNLIISTVAIASSFALLATPAILLRAESNASGSMQASVTQPSTNFITINSITTIQTSGVADGTFENGWKWIFDVTIPNRNETSLSMKFDNWLRVGSGGNTIPVANNLRFYSAQSSSSPNAGSATYITSANNYSSSIFLNGDDPRFTPSATSRRIQITVEFRIPSGTPIGGYSNTFGIRTQ